MGFVRELEGLGGVGLNEEADVVVDVGGLGATGGDVVGVHVEDAAIEQGGDAGESGLFANFAQGVGEDAGIAVAMPAGLEPAMELGVADEQGLAQRGIDDPGGSGDMAREQGAFKAKFFGAHEGEDAGEHGGFLGVEGEVGFEGGDEVSAGGHGRSQGGLVVEAAPKIPGGGGTPGAPGFGEAFHLRRQRRLAEGIGAGNGVADAQVAGGEDVGTAESEDEKHLSRPDADAADLDELGDDVLVRQTGEGAEAEAPGPGALREIENGSSLGGGEAAGAERIRTKREDGGGRQAARAHRGMDARPDGGGGAPAELLRDDRAGQRRKYGRMIADGIGSGASDDGAEDRVGAAQMGGGGMHGNGRARGRILKYAMVFRMSPQWMTVALAAALAAAAYGQKPAPQPPPEEETPVIRVDVELVNLFFSARDRKGGYVRGLEAQDFEVYEDGKRQEIKFFARETDLPLTLGLLVDVSRSQERLIETEKRASERFFEQVLRKKDLAFLISFGPDTDLLQDYTNSPVLLRRGLEQLRVTGGVSGVYTPPTVPVPGGGRGTVLYEAVWLAAKEKLRREVGRKAIILITDGVDVGSRIKIGEAIEEAQRSDAIIYPILFEDPRYTSAMFGGASGEGAMKRMAEETGGRMFRVDRRQTLEQIYDQIAEEMRTQYVLGYTPANGAKDGTFRKVEIRPKDKNVRIQARKGYYAGPPEAAR